MLNSLSDFSAHAFFIRDAKFKDLDDICELGSLLNTFNLPANKVELEQVIATSENSFSLNEQDPTKRAFLFVLVNQDDKVIGTSQIFAKHGTLESPHTYFEVNVDERYSETLKKYFRHRTLHLRQSFDGPTEIGSLVLDQKYRSNPAKLGRNLSFVRFLFMAMNKDFFSHRVLAELLPPLGPNFESALWDAIGRKFTGLDYYEADMISRNNKEFINTLFPGGDLYVSLLPDNAQEVIGQIGRHSRAAAHLLSKIGFRYSYRVDPFDGGPHFEANQDEISLIKEAMTGSVRLYSECFERAESILRVGLLGRYQPQNESGVRFRASVVPYSFDREHREICLAQGSMAALMVQSGEPVTVIDMTHQEAF